MRFTIGLFALAAVSTAYAAAVEPREVGSDLGTQVKSTLDNTVNAGHDVKLALKSRDLKRERDFGMKRERRDVASNVATALGNAQSAVDNVASKLTAELKGNATNIAAVKSLAGELTSTVSKLKSTLDGLTDEITVGKRDLLRRDTSDSVTALFKSIADVVTKLENVLGELPALGPVLSSLASELNPLLSGLLTTLNKIVGPLAEDLITTLKGLLAPIDSLLDPVLKVLDGLLGGLLGDLGLA